MIRDMTNLQMELLNKLADDESQWDKRQELELPERDRNFINKAVIDEMEISAESIQEKIKNSFKKYADKVFVSEEGKEYTYAQTEKSVNAKIMCSIKQYTINTKIVCSTKEHAVKNTVQEERNVP